MISCNERDLSEHIFPNWTNTPNISREERQAIRALKNNTSIIIKPADKGSAVVLLDRADYIAEGLRQLSDITFYTILDHCPTIEYHLRIDQYITTLVIKKELSDECAKYLRHYKPRTSQFYMLPKIHKPTRPPPGRPIISGNDSPTERISQLVDHFLQPCVPQLRSFVRDSVHFLQMLQPYTDSLPDGTILCTLDVSSLYTNIPQNEGIRACASALQANPPIGNITIQSILHLMKLILTMNNF